jgi:hypothetical protein
VTDKEYDEFVAKIKLEAYKEFAEFLISKSKKNVINICKLPDYVREMGCK